MKQRLGMIWMALLTAYMAIVTTDMYTTLRSVDACQVSTLRYMEKSAKILRRIKHCQISSLQEAEKLEKAERMKPLSSEDCETDQAQLSQSTSNSHT